MIEVLNFKKHEKNTLKGFFDVRISSFGLEIRGCCLHEKNGSRWVQLPSRPYEKDGKQTWSYILEFYEKERKEWFSREVLKALGDTNET